MWGKDVVKQYSSPSSISYSSHMSMCPSSSTCINMKREGGREDVGVGRCEEGVG